jgi:hypothetical protein
MTSVNVPPRSIQNCQPGVIYLQSVESSWRRKCIACIILAPTDRFQGQQRRKMMQATGTSRQALLVGYALEIAPGGLPWQRVVAACALDELLWKRP